MRYNHCSVIAGYWGIKVGGNRLCAHAYALYIPILLMNDEDVPKCVACYCYLTVEHFVIDWQDIADNNIQYCKYKQELWEASGIEVFDLSWEVGLFTKI